MKKIKISVVLATFNEEENLGRCFEAVRQLADEIIVVDGQSTDRTVEIAEKYGARVKITTNKPIFHINKQMAIDLAKGDWILQLDADEVVPPALRKEILAIMGRPLRESRQATLPESPRADDQPVAYYIPRKNFFLGRWLKKGGQYPDAVIRLFKKDKAYLPCQSVHEQMMVKGKTGQLQNDLLHYPFPTFSEYLKKFNAYSSLRAEEHCRSSLSPNFFNSLRYLLIVPAQIFFKVYFVNKGFLDGFLGFVFALFSGLFEANAYFKFWELKNAKKK